MMGTGRATLKASNSWDIFNWLPKKYQSAHNIDLTKLQNHTAEELLEVLPVHPDISHALYNFLLMGDTPLSFSQETGDSDEKGGQKALENIKNMLDTPLPSLGLNYRHGRSLDRVNLLSLLF